MSWEIPVLLFVLADLAAGLPTVVGFPALVGLLGWEWLVEGLLVALLLGLGATLYVRRRLLQRERDAQRAGQAKWAAALASMTDAVLITDAQGRFLDFNDAFAIFLRFKNKEECFKTLAEYPNNILDIFLPGGELAPPDQWVVPRALRGETAANVEYTLKRKDTGDTWIASHSFAPVRSQDGTIVGTVLVARDITAQRSAEEALRTSEQRLTWAIQGSGGGAWDWNLATDEAWWSPQMHALWGAPTNMRVCGENAMINVHPDDREPMRRAIVQAIAEHVDFHCDFRLDHPVRGLRWMTSSGHALYDTTGKAVRIVGITIDITHRKQTEQALAESERNYREIFNASNDAIFIHDEQGTILDVNDRVCEMFRTERDKVLNTPLISLIQDTSPYSAVEMLDKLQLAFQRGPQVFQWRARRDDGSLVWCEVALRACEIRGQKRLIASVRDITDRKNVEERLHQMETQLAHVARLSAMGEMVAGIAHELNQPFFAILNYAKSIRNFLAGGEPKLDLVHECAEEIAEAATWAGAIVKRLRSFARRTESQRSWCRINDIVREAMAMLAFRAQRAHVTLEAHLCPESPVVLANHVEIQQIFVNLLQNAIEAMENTTPERRRAVIRTSVRDRVVAFSVADHGIGLPPGDLSEIFNPFVTTKPGGLGMGLAITTTLLEAHGGELRATSNPEGGAVFEGVLPLAEEDHAHAG